MSTTETSEQMDARLLRVIAQAQFDVFPADYIWRPMSLDHRPSRDAIACVRDGEVWHEFVPAPASTSAQRYRVVSFHFTEGTDAAGFVAWLAAHLKRSAKIVATPPRSSGRLRACSITGAAPWPLGTDLWHSYGR